MEVGALLFGAAAGTAPEPGEVLAEVDVFAQVLPLSAPVLAPLDVRLPAQDARALSAARPKLGPHERADVEADAVVDVWLPPDGLAVKGPPAHEDVEGRIAGRDALQLGPQVERGG